MLIIVMCWVLLWKFVGDVSKSNSQANRVGGSLMSFVGNMNKRDAWKEDE